MTDWDTLIGKFATNAILHALPETEEIWFHGARARGDHQPGDGWEFLVLYKDGSVPHKLDAVTRLRPVRMAGASVQCDPTSSKNIPASAAWTACQEGTLLFDRKRTEKVSTS